MSSQRASSLPPNALSQNRGTTTIDHSILPSQTHQLLQYFDPASIIAEARENPPQDVEEAKCLLALVRAERDMQRAKAQLADCLTEYNRLKAAKAWKGLGDAEMTVGRARSILSENGFSCSELTAALRRSKAVDGHQPIVRFIPLLD